MLGIQFFMLIWQKTEFPLVTNQLKKFNYNQNLVSSNNAWKKLGRSLENVWKILGIFLEKAWKKFGKML